MNRQKIFKNFFIFTSVFVILFSSCGGGPSNGAIFAAIEGEEKLNKGTVPWAVTSLVYYKGALYCTNGSSVYTKGKYAKRGWAAFPTNYDGSIAALAADDNNLYVLTYSKTNPQDNCSDRKLYVLQGSSTGAVTLTGNPDVIFDNQSYSSGREAFVTLYGSQTSGGATYKLNGTSAPTSTGKSDIASAAKGSGGTEFYQTYLAVSDFSNTRTFRVDLDGNHSSFAKDENSKNKNNPVNSIICSDGTSIPVPLTESKNGKITGLAFYRELGKDYILVATSSSGYHRISLDGTNTSTPNPHKNGEQLAGAGIIEDSFWTLDSGAIYAGVTAQDQKRYGLWAYYLNDSWNRD
ncbi:MAG: hypothetical protein GX297_07660 [Treponema sp.]|jgi:hypothetical protein|nr:hypothetical protein [Treponema sp.]